MYKKADCTESKVLACSIQRILEKSRCLILKGGEIVGLCTTKIKKYNYNKKAKGYIFIKMMNNQVMGDVSCKKITTALQKESVQILGTLTGGSGD